jgi:exonuclease VII large subunit
VDLWWLNDLELARTLCNTPLPCFTEIGHVRDSTILDEIAHQKFDTPSKVALHISRTIHDNAPWTGSRTGPRWPWLLVRPRSRSWAGSY